VHFRAARMTRWPVNYDFGRNKLWPILRYDPCIYVESPHSWQLEPRLWRRTPEYGTGLQPSDRDVSLFQDADDTDLILDDNKVDFRSGGSDAVSLLKVRTIAGSQDAGFICLTSHRNVECTKVRKQWITGGVLRPEQDFCSVPCLTTNGPRMTTAFLYRVVSMKIAPSVWLAGP
jgi:hypothetical protein